MFTLKNHIFIVIMYLFTSYSHADTLNIMTANEPPFGYLDDQKQLQGFTVDVVKEMQKRVGNKSIISTTNWSRLIESAKRESNLLFFTFTRTPERENLFHWVKGVVQNTWGFSAVNSSANTKQISFEEAKKLGMVGVHRNTSLHKYLLNNGFKKENLYPTTDIKQAFQMMVNGRANALFYGIIGTYNLAKEYQVPFNKIKIIHNVKKQPAYIGISKKTPIEIVNRWVKAGKEMNEDGTFEKIVNKWIKKMKAETGLESHFDDNLWKLFKKE